MASLIVTFLYEIAKYSRNGFLQLGRKKHLKNWVKKCFKAQCGLLGFFFYATCPSTK